MLPYLISSRSARATCRTSICSANWARSANPCCSSAASRHHRRVAVFREYLLAGGNYEIILCERGIRTFETYTRNTMDISAIPSFTSFRTCDDRRSIARHRTPRQSGSYGSGVRRSGAIHAHRGSSPADKALSDGAQSLYPEQFAKLMDQLRMIALRSAARSRKLLSRGSLFVVRYSSFAVRKLSNHLLPLMTSRKRSGSANSERLTTSD